MCQVKLGELSALLPPAEPYTYTSYGMMYGADRIAAMHCSLRRVPSRCRGLWQHGWIDRRSNIDPYVIADYVEGNDGVREPQWVARKDQEEYLKSQGFSEVKAIGLPIVYLPPKTIQRCPGTLLVMPMHSVDASQHKWPFEEYAEAIASIRQRFQEVVVCVHNSCWKHGNWTESFRRRGFQVISGAAHNDRNAYERMRVLFSIFEFVTTNGLGSQVAYAAYFGAKVSLFGPIAECRKEDFVGNPVYARMRELDILLEMNSESALRRDYRDFFCDPDRAVLRTEWAGAQLGADCKVSPKEMRRLFGWTRPQLMCASLKQRAREIRPRAIQRVGHWRRMLSSPQYAEVHRQFASLKKMPRGVAGETTLFGQTVRFTDSADFLEDYQRIFQQEVFRFSSSSPNPRIIDWSADIGLRVIYWKRLFAKPRIVAFEPNSARATVLAYNCRPLGDDAIEILTGPEDSPNAPAQPPSLERSLNQPADALHLRISGGDLTVIERSAHLLDRVGVIAVEYLDQVAKPQSLPRLLSILEAAGFRIHLHTLMKSEQPWYQRETQEKDGVNDLDVYVFGIRTTI
jgi:hypothetical protein